MFWGKVPAFLKSHTRRAKNKKKIMYGKNNFEMCNLKLHIKMFIFTPGVL